MHMNKIGNYWIKKKSKDNEMSSFNFAYMKKMLTGDILRDMFIIRVSILVVSR